MRSTDVPELYRKAYLRAVAGKVSPRTAIRLLYLEPLLAYDVERHDTFNGRQGVMNPWWNFVHINIPNVPTPNDWKLANLQITFWPFDDGGDPVTPLSMWTNPPASQQIMTHSLLLPDGWAYQSWEFWIPGNPSYETVTLDTGILDLYTARS